MKGNHYVAGLDFGTDSVRAVIVDASDGSEISSSVAEYPRWKQGKYCDPQINMFRQHPLDYIESLENSVRETLSNAPRGTAEKIVGISVDTTGSTPVVVARSGKPLALMPGFEENPNAMFVLWKDHTAVKEAMEITEYAKSWGGTDYTKFSGGVYSAEWFWAKMLHVLREDKAIANTTFSFVEHCDWMPGLLTGNVEPLSLKRSRCAAGHKAMWHKSFSGLPSETFLSGIDPLLAGIRERLYGATFTSNIPAGMLCTEWAKRLGLSEDVVVGVGAFDAHMGAVGGEIIPYHLCKIIGTSTCDMLVAPLEEIGDKPVRGICGQVDGSILPGMLGMEAGQSAFGDVYAWFKNVLLWPLHNLLSGYFPNESTAGKVIEETADKIIPELSKQAEKIKPEDSAIVALDWVNGRRTPDANQLLKGAIAGLTLGSDAPKIFRALVESTAFGAKMIVDRFISEGINIEGIIALGGIPKKSPFVMQVLADVLNMDIRIVKSDQACALGSAMFAATVAEIYSTVEEAQKAMGNGFESVIAPNPENSKHYEILYKKYKKFAGFIEHELTGK